MSDYDSIYPKINTPNGENFRLTKSCEILSGLEKKERHYECVRKKYSRARNVFQNVCVGSGSISIILSMSGLGTSLSGFGIVVGVPLGVVGGFCGLISVLTGTFSKRFGKKISKHEQTSAVARAKISTIKDLISKALVDQKISDDEFSLIIKEADKFEKLKMEIIQRYIVVDEKKGVTMELLREEARKSLIQQLIPTAPPK